MDSIRVEKPSCWVYFHEKARVLKFEGRLRESEEILRAILKHALNYPQPNIIFTMMELADILVGFSRDEEGITLWENIFSISTELFGIEHRYSRDRCETLGFYYAYQGRFDDAILHFQQSMEKLALSSLDDPDSRDDYVQDLHSWIAKVEWMKAEKEREETMEV